MRAAHSDGLTGPAAGRTGAERIIGTNHRTDHPHPALAPLANRNVDAQDSGYQAHPRHPILSRIAHLLLQHGPADRSHLELAGITRPALEQQQHDGPRGVDLQLEDVATGPLGRVVVAGTYTDPLTKETMAYARQFCD